MNDEIFVRFRSYLKSQDGLRQSPPGYMNWAQYVKVMGCVALRDYKEGKAAFEKTEAVINKLCTLDIPPRYVSKEISLAWQHTKIPVLNWNNPFVMPGYVLFLPCPIKEQVPEYFADAWFLASLMVLHEPPGLHAYTTSLTYDSATRDFRFGFHHMPLDPGVDYNNGFDEEERAIAIASINSWLTHAYEPELIEQLPASARGGFGRRTCARSPIAPTWIGRNFKIRTDSSPAPGQETGIKVRPHWRSGHWHTVRHGKGKEHTRTQWYRPTYVNAEQVA